MAQGKLPECKNCLYADHDFVPSEGALDAEVMFIGDSPWHFELKRGRPFVGPAGETFEDLLQGVDLDRRDVFISNTVHCLPEALGMAHPPEVVDLCTKLFLKKELRQIQPKLIVPMGNVALKALGITKNIGTARGLLTDVGVDGETHKALPTYHPSFLNRRPAYLPFSFKDFQAIKYFLDHGHEKPVNDDLDYRSVTTETQVRCFFKEFEKTKLVAWDTETTGLDFRSDFILSMQFSFVTKTGYCVPFYHLPYAEFEGKPLDTTYNTQVITRLYELLHDPTKIYFFHNGKFDLHMLHEFFMKAIGLPIQIDAIRWHDTMSMYALLDENTSKSLKVITPMFTDIRYTAEELSDVKGGRTKKMTLPQMTMYGCKDVDGPLRLAPLFGKELRAQGLWGIYAQHDASDCKVVPILYKMEQFGAPVDQEELVRLKMFMGGKLERYHARMEKIVGHSFNPNSGPQLSQVLFEELGFPIPEKKTATGKICTDKFVIEGLIEAHPDHPFLKAFRMHRSYASINSTFVKGLEEKLWPDGRVRPDFGVSAMVSGRIACYKPNLANIPREREFEEGVIVSIRNVFASKVGKKIVYTDSMQIEFKVMAIISKDKALIKAIFDNREDFHTLVARTLYPGYREQEALLCQCTDQLGDVHISEKLRAQLRVKQQSCEVFLKTGRTRSKNFNFGRNYGAELPKLAECLGITEDKIPPFLQRLAKRFPDFEDFLVENPQRAIREGELTSPFGRKRRFPMTPDEYVRASQARQGANFSCQSAAAYAIRAALVRSAHAFERSGMETYLFNQVFDCLIAESPHEEIIDAARILATEMIAPVPELGGYSFSIDLGVGRSWQSAEKNAVKIYTMADFDMVVNTDAFQGKKL